MTWPLDADGDVFRRLDASEFDFRQVHLIDFNVDFAAWPPPDAAIAALRENYPDLIIFEPDEHGEGYIRFKIKSVLTYELVVFVQKSVSALVVPYGGTCESWGVMQS